MGQLRLSWQIIWINCQESWRSEQMIWFNCQEVGRWLSRAKKIRKMNISSVQSNLLLSINLLVKKWKERRLAKRGLPHSALRIHEGGDHGGSNILQVELVAGECEQAEHDHVQDRLPIQYRSIISKNKIASNKANVGAKKVVTLWRSKNYNLSSRDSLFK